MIKALILNHTTIPTFATKNGEPRKHQYMKFQKTVALVLHPEIRGWIFEKIAERLKENLTIHGWTASITEKPLINAEINHHMSWSFANIASPRRSSMFVTHLDDYAKVNFVKNLLHEYVNFGICMSNDTVQQCKIFGVDSNKLCFVPPCNDQTIKPRPIAVGLTTNVYKDGRKRENLLVKLANDIDLSEIEFSIFGSGWENVVSKLRSRGVRVIYNSGSKAKLDEYADICLNVPKLDYYLYLGCDEGSLGTLDALTAGVKCVITSQGFHNDLPKSEIITKFLEYNELKKIFEDIIAKRNAESNIIKNRTWENYARAHSLIWESMLNDNLQNIQEQINLTFDQDPRNTTIKGKFKNRSIQLLLNTIKPRHLLSSIGRARSVRGLRRFLRNRTSS